VKEVGFKPGVKERGVMNVQSGESNVKVTRHKWLLTLDCTAPLSPCKGRLTSFCYDDDDNDDDDETASGHLLHWSVVEVTDE